MDEVGQKLKAARIEKGLTIDDLQQKTKIQKRYLIAIEEGQFDQLPGDFYVRAFVKQYSEEVGLDSNELLNEYDASLKSDEAAIVENESINNQTRKSRDEEDPRMEMIKKYLPQGIVILLVVVILGAIFGIATQNKHSNKTSIPDQSQVVKKETKKNSKDADTNKKTSKTTDTKTTTKEKNKSSKKKDTDKISITKSDEASGTFEVKNISESNRKMVLSGINAQAWVQVTIDGQSAWQGALDAGNEQEVEIPEGAQSIEVQTGNAPETAISIGGKKVNTENTEDTSIVQTYTFNIVE